MKTLSITLPDNLAERINDYVQAGEQSIEARFEDETIRLTQKLMATLFEVTVPTINEHLKNIYETGEIVRGATIRKFLTVQKEGIAMEENHCPGKREIFYESLIA